MSGKFHRRPLDPDRGSHTPVSQVSKPRLPLRIPVDRHMKLRRAAFAASIAELSHIEIPNYAVDCHRRLPFSGRFFGRLRCLVRPSTGSAMAPAAAMVQELDRSGRQLQGGRGIALLVKAR